MTITSGRLSESAAHAVVEISEIYLRRERQAHYHWRFGLLVVIVLAAPLAVGEIAGLRGAGVVGTLAAWFVAPSIPPRGVLHRFEFLTRRLILVTATTAAGVAVGDRPVCAAAVLVVLALMIPIPAMTITPLITFIMAVATPSELSGAAHVAAFAAGGAAAVLVLLVPAAASPIAPDFGGLRIGTDALRRIADHVRRRSPEFRYACQAAVVVPSLFLVLTALHWPHAGWVLVGVLTTLRPSWDATEARVVKRSVGMVAGAIVTAVVLTVSTMADYWVIAAITVVCGGIARPLRQYNYGYWPILGTPVLLLLIDLTTPLQITDSAIRLGDNLLGALVTLVVTLVLWPHRTQHPLRVRRAPPRTSASSDSD